MIMSNIYFCSDLHLGHGGISKEFRSQFSNDQDHDQFFIDAFKQRKIRKRDIVFFVGDIIIDKKSFPLLDDIYCDRRIILGNHDIQNNRHIDDFRHYFNHIYGALRYKEFWITHMPIHTNELYDRVNLHGHVHSNTIKDDRYFNLCPENTIPIFGNPFVKLDELRNYFKLGK